MSQQKQGIDENMVRHMVLNTIRHYKTKFGPKYGDNVVLAFDDRHYWRKTVFPYYKSGRKDAREKSTIDWNVIFLALNNIREELRETFPYRVLQVERAEADDIIGTLCQRFGSHTLKASNAEELLILSADKDFVQLQCYSNVSQYSPMQKRHVTTTNPARYLEEHILRGDRGDGIPNFLSDDDTFVSDKRQKPISQKKINGWNGYDAADFCDENMLRGYRRNEQLIDLSFIPADIKDSINEQYDSYVLNDRSKLFNYFITHKLKLLTTSLGEF
jgi:5'-3' exonuclease